MPLNATVPEDMMLYKQLKILENDQSAIKVVVESGCAYKVKVHVKDVNSRIQWDFQTAHNDICFGLSFKEVEHGESSPIISPHRVESHLVPESGTFPCLTSGFYELIFDNTYSWMTNKELIYKIKVVPPGDTSFS